MRALLYLPNKPMHPLCSPELEGAAPILPMATGAAVEEVKGTTAGTVASLGTDTR